MRIMRTGIAVVPGLALLTGCASATPAAPTGVATQVVMASATPQQIPATRVASTDSPPLSFDPAIHEDPVAGYAFEYPAYWTVGPSEQQSRGGITAFTSWTRPADVFPDETPPGETRLDVTVQLWDPKGDLEAFLAQRMGAWSASGITIVSEEKSALADGRPTASYVVQGSDGAQAYFFFTTLGDDYLVLSGSGDLVLLAEIAGTVRPLPLAY